MTKHLKLFADTFHCPDCKGKFDITDNIIKCSSCGQQFQHTNNLLHLADDKFIQPDIPFYNDEEYIRDHKKLLDMHKAHYKKGSMSGILEGWFKKEFTKIISKEAKRPFIEIGCGTGSSISYLGYPKPVIGIDINKDLITEAASKYTESSFVRVDISKMPMPENSVHTFISIAVLEHVFYLEKFIESIAAMLHPEGYFYVMIPTEGGALWKLLNTMAAKQYSGKFNINYAKISRIEHCNKAITIENTLSKFFHISKIKKVPFNFMGVNSNFIFCYELRKRA